MTAEREQQFLELVREFPDSPMGHFSLGKYYLDASRYAEAVKSLTEAIRIDPEYAAAMVALGDAHAGLGDKQAAVESYERARATPHGKKDLSLNEDIDQRIAELA